MMTPPPWDPKVALSLGTYGDPRGMGVPYERGIHVDERVNGSGGSQRDMNANGLGFKV